MSDGIPDREPDLTKLEQRLRGWCPATPSAGRDRMLFAAGRTAAGAESHVRLWRGVAALLVFVSAGSVAGWGLEHTARQQAETRLAHADRGRPANPAVPTHPEHSTGRATVKLAQLDVSSYLILNRRLMASQAEELGIPASRETRDSSTDRSPAPTLRVSDGMRLLNL